MSRRRRTAPMLTVISWRGIPAQVVARDGVRTARQRLPDRFQEAIDRAAVRTGSADSDAYLGRWEQRSRRCGDDLRAEVDAEVARLDERLPPAALAALVTALPPDVAPHRQKEPQS